MHYLQVKLCDFHVELVSVPELFLLQSDMSHGFIDHLFSDTLLYIMLFEH